jgi:hypothetical protein
MPGTSASNLNRNALALVPVMAGPPGQDLSGKSIAKAPLSMCDSTRLTSPPQAVGRISCSSRGRKPFSRSLKYSAVIGYPIMSTERVAVACQIGNYSLAKYAL